MVKRLNTFDQIKHILIERFAIEPSSIQPETDLQKELNLDSIDALSLLFAVNETFSIRLPEKVLDNVHTIAELVEVVDHA